VTDHRSPRGGRFLENIGTFDPVHDSARFVIDDERLTYWRTRGALPSATLDRLLKRRDRTAAVPEAT
jgi:small subunit ribosomal protein S16